MLDINGAWTEQTVEIENPQQMRAFNEEFPVPDGALTDPRIAYARLRADIPIQ
jgi:hypothetical protein